MATAKAYVYWLATMAWTGLISWYSIIPMPKTGISGAVLNLPFSIPHFIAYAILTVLLSLALKNIHYEHALPAAILFSISYGIILELVQLTIPYRTASIFDASMNAVGALIAGFALYAKESKYGPKNLAKR
jgi:VanZ family protein